MSWRLISPATRALVGHGPEGSTWYFGDGSALSHDKYVRTAPIEHPTSIPVGAELDGRPRHQANRPLTEGLDSRYPLEAEAVRLVDELLVHRPRPSGEPADLPLEIEGAASWGQQSDGIRGGSGRGVVEVDSPGAAQSTDDDDASECPEIGRTLVDVHGHEELGELPPVPQAHAQRLPVGSLAGPVVPVEADVGPGIEITERRPQRLHGGAQAVASEDPAAPDRG